MATVPPLLRLLLVVLVSLCVTALSDAAASPSPRDGPSGAAVLRLHNLFSGNMTLARSPQQAVLWGSAAPGASVSVTVDGAKSGQATVDEHGNFTVTLLAHAAALSTVVQVSDGATVLTLRNVAFGDILFCSGQSNMQMPLDYSFGSAAEIANSAQYSNIRLFSMAGNQYANQPLYESRLSYPTGWVLPSPKTLQFAPNDVYNYFSGVCYYAGKDLYLSLNANKTGADIVPIGLIQGAYAGAGIVPFLSPASAGKCGYIPPSSQPTQQLTVIYNAMVYPYIKLRISAVLWYQGESDTGNTTRYSCTFPTLIQDWRQQWQLPSLPFYSVVLHPYNGGQGLADIRQVQMASLALPHTGIANAIDLGDLGGPSGQIHPRNKSLVGHRLSLALQRGVYGRDVVSAGPSMDGISITITPGSPTQVQLSLQYSQGAHSSGLYLQQTPNCTSCCAAMQNFARVRLLNESSPVVYNPTFAVDSEARTVSLTFSTAQTPKPGQLLQLATNDEPWPQCVLYNDAKLPALPMRTVLAVPAYASAAAASPVQVGETRHQRASRPVVAVAAAAAAAAVPANLSIDTGASGLSVSQDLYGVFFEEISHSGVGGLYSQLVDNTNFETSYRTYAPWRPFAPAGVSHLASLNTSIPLTQYSPHSLRVQTSTGQQSATVGLLNPGFWGMHVPAGSTSFAVSLFALSPSASVSSVTVSLSNANRSVTYGQATLSRIGTKWQRFEAVLTTKVSVADPQAVLTLTWTVPASSSAVVHFDVISAFPQPGWRGLPFIRADIAETIAALRPSIFRFPGGGYVDGNTLATRFAWNNTIGPLQNRTGHSGSWGYYSEDGLGIYEYFSFAEQLRDVWDRPTRTVWVINAGISNAEAVPVDQLGPWIQSALDSIEFISGGVSTHYGGIRASMGHPAPFKLDYLAIGNENCYFGGEPFYLTHFPLFYKAIKAQYPQLPLIANCNPDSIKPFELWDFHTYPTPQQMWDQQGAFDQYKAGDPKIFVSEYASFGVGAGYGNLQGAVAEAGFMNSFERNSQAVQMASYAPFLGNVNELNWHPNMIQFDSYRVYGTPSYYNGLIYANSFRGVEPSALRTYQSSLTGGLPHALSVSVTGGALTANFSASKNGSTAVLIVKLANFNQTEQTVAVSMTGLAPSTAFPALADVATLRSSSNNATEENSIEQPSRVNPVYSTLAVQAPHFSVTLPPYSVTSIRVYTQ